MAVTPTSIGADLILCMDNGLSSTGAQLIKNRTYSSMKSDAVNDDVYAVAQSLIGLTSKTNISVLRRDTAELIFA